MKGVNRKGRPEAAMMIALVVLLSALLVSCPLFRCDESLGTGLLDQIGGRW